MVEKESDKPIIAQLAVRGIIFVLFFIGLFTSLPSFLLYFLLLLIISNFTLGFFTKHRGILVNIIFLVLYLLLFVMIIDYVATIIGSILSLFHFGILFKEHMWPSKK